VKKMGYCEIGDVKSLNPSRVYDEDSKPTLDQVVGFIENVSSEINLVISSLGYTTPITAPQDLLNYIKLVSSYKVAFLAEEASLSVSKKSSEHVKVLKELYAMGIKFIKENNAIFGDLPRVRYGDLTSYAQDNTDDISNDPWIERDMNF